MIKILKSGKYNTLFSRFFLMFVLLSFIFSLIAVFFYIYQKKKEKLYDLKEISLKIQRDFYFDREQISSFFIYDLVDTNFYQTNQSTYIDTHDSLFNAINYYIEVVLSEDIFNNDSFSPIILKEFLSDYDKNFDSLVTLSLERGFKDYGYVGKMRNYAHILENFDDFEKADILMLRRHEKDYIIRRDDKYVDLFKEKIAIYKNEVLQSKLSENSKIFIDTALSGYLKNFLTVVKHDSILGIKNNTNLTKKLSENQIKIQFYIENITKNTDKYIKKSKKRLRLIFFILSSLLIVISFSIGLILTKYLTRPISNLSKNIKTFVESDFKKTDNFEYITTISEIVILIEYYFSMKKQISSLLFDFEQKVKEKTEEVHAQKETIERQKVKVERINKNLISSIKYAKQIQQAILPSSDELSNCFNDYFVINKPRDIVSGDFLWFKKIKNADFDLKLLAIADCTGHGVPGALMSMLSIAYLNEIVLRKEIIHANEVLEVLRLNIISNFDHDGLDLAFVIIDMNNNKIIFSGANRNLYIKTENDFIKLKGNRMPIGKYPVTTLFDEKVISFKRGDEIYAFTDGITDQLNSDGHKFSTKRLINIIDSETVFSNKKNIIIDNFKIWKANMEQTDDVLFFAASL